VVAGGYTTGVGGAAGTLRGRGNNAAGGGVAKDLTTGREDDGSSTGHQRPGSALAVFTVLRATNPGRGEQLGDVEEV